jgi:putative membrane protein
VSDIPLLNGLVYGVAGIALFGAAFAIFVKAWPIDLWREIRERNVAAAILAGAVALGLCWIIAATMH